MKYSFEKQQCPVLESSGKRIGGKVCERVAGKIKSSYIG